MNTRAQELVRQLHLQPHPEGGFYAEVFRSGVPVQPGDGRSPRSALTAIYFLLVDGGCSRWHQVLSDEVWCHLEGATLALHLLHPAQRQAQQQVQTHRLGPVSAHTLPQCTVPAQHWQAAVCEGGYTLAACFVAPGFEFEDFQLMPAGHPLAPWLRSEHPALARLL